MTVVHANDPTTRVLSQLYDGRADVSCRVAERSASSDVQRALRASDAVMMLGHGNSYGLFSTPDKHGQYVRHIISSKQVEWLRGKTCIGIWCYANEFADSYGLQGLFSGMIISEPEEAEREHIAATEAEIRRETEKFARRLRHCIDTYGIEETPMRMKELDDVHSELTNYNYGNLYYHGKEWLLRQIVKMLYDYTECMMNTRQMKEMYEKRLKHCRYFALSMPEWLNRLSYYFSLTAFNDSTYFQDEQMITVTDFRHEITTTLYRLRCDGKYRDIILKDYSKYV